MIRKQISEIKPNMHRKDENTMMYSVVACCIKDILERSNAINHLKEQIEFFNTRQSKYTSKSW